ncbi:MAG: VOC family protein [Gemmatales bacterium]|nr:VOC family protein [Gemmatales bacterium]
MRLYMIELQVGDLHKSVMWYQHFGWQVAMLKPQDGFALLQHGASRLALKQRVAASEELPERPTSRVRLHFEVSDLEQAITTLAERGLTVCQPLKVSPEGYRRVLYRDPDGYEICLFEWLPSSTV